VRLAYEVYFVFPVVVKQGPPVPNNFMDKEYK
jgi:hypothetical protein